MRKLLIVIGMAGAVALSIIVVCPMKQTQAADDEAEKPAEETAKPVAITAALHWLKPQYVLGDDILFLVSMEAAENGRLPDPYPSWVVTIYRPDGTTFQRHSSPQIGGMVHAQSQSVGCGFPDKEIEPGKYRLELRVEGAEEIARGETEIIEWDGFDKIEAGFRFHKQGKIAAGAHVPITFWVRNGTDQTIRFPIRAYPHMGAISGSVTRTDEHWHRTFWYPVEKLLGPGEKKFTTSRDRFTWGNLAVIPAIVLRPGETFERRLSLEDTYNDEWRLQPGAEYEISFSTRLDLLVGEPDGALAPASPMRKRIHSSAQFQT